MIVGRPAVLARSAIGPRILKGATGVLGLPVTCVGTPATVKPSDEPFTRISSSAPASVIVSLRRPTPFTSLNTTSIVAGKAERLMIAPRSGETRSAVGNSTGAVDAGV